MTILERLKEQVADASKQTTHSPHLSWYDPGPPVRPRASCDDILEAERKLGFSLPPLLRSIYLEIGNGGWLVGPGIYGIGGSNDTSEEENAVSISLDMASEFEWWREYLVIADQGCSMYSCIDCGDSSYRVYRLDGNGYSEQSTGNPTENSWYLESASIDDWFSAFLDERRNKIIANPSVLSRSRESNKPWWRFW